MRFVIAFIAAWLCVRLFLFAATLIMRGNFEAEIELCAERLELKIRRKPIMNVLPVHVCATILLKNLYTGEETEIKTGRICGGDFSARLENVRCGALEARVVSARFGAGTLFFTKKANLEAVGGALVMPSPDGALEYFSVLSGEELTEKRSSSGLPDGAREYRNGDRLSDIHMKLSAKAGKYMVRDRFGGGGAVSVGFEQAGDPELAEKNAGLLLGIAADCFSKGLTCRAVRGSGAVEIRGAAELERGFYRIFTSDFSDGSEIGEVRMEISGGEVRVL